MAEPASPPSLPPTQLLPDAEAWLTANNLNEFLPFLREAGFTDIDSISTITESDAEAIGISQLGARRRLVRAIQRLAATLPPSPFPHPHLNSTPPRAGQPGGSTSPYAGQPLSLRLSSPDDATEDDGTPSKKKRGPMRCGKCHQWKKMCHGHCTVRCTSFATCPTRHRRAHPELKEEEKEQRRKEEEERKRKREEEKEEKRREKKVRHEEETLTTSPGGVVPGESSAPGVMMLDNGERLVLLDKDVAEAASEIVAASLQHHHHHQQQQQQHQLQQQHHQQQHEHQQLPPPQQQHPQLHINLHPVV